MARINLLPWRQEERLRKNKEFTVIIASALALTALAVGIGFAMLNRNLDQNRQANEFITTENARLDKDLEAIATLEERREAMISRMKIIQDLQGRRSVPVRIWDDIARAIPPALYLVGMKREGDVITLTGFADNANVVSQLIRNLDASPWLANSIAPNMKSDIEAYQPAIPKQPTAQDGATRPIYPEDGYINFTVTTQVKIDETTLSQYTAPTGATAEQMNAQPVEAPPAAAETQGGAQAGDQMNAPAGAPAANPEAATAPTNSTAPANTAAQASTNSAASSTQAPEQAPAGGQ